MVCRWRNTIRGDRGATATEYAGLLLLAAGLAGALATSGLPGLAVVKVDQAMCGFSPETCRRRGIGPPAGGPALIPRPSIPPATARPPLPHRPGQPRMNRRVYRSTGIGKRVERREGGPPTGDPVIDRVYQYLGTVGTYFWDRFGRNSFDGRGGRLNVEVDDDSEAEWNLELWRMTVGRDATLDVVAHEFTHGVVSATAGLANYGQPAALNEALADIFASNVDQNWQIGESTERGVLRDLSNPRRFGHPAHVSQYRSGLIDLTNQNSHYNSTVISHAYYRMVRYLGRTEAEGRTVAEQIVYRALTRHLASSPGFEDFRTAALRATADLYGAKSPSYLAVNRAFAEVGLNGRWRPS
ncbi:M4 family metallopeptidase [Thermomonospora echinospora]|nr:M4 family metallopeptidase [Thermomonospora echinospora]